MFDKRILKDARTSLIDMMFKDIRDAISIDANMAAAILTMCAIDTLGVLYYQKSSPIDSTRDSFVKFVESPYFDDKYDRDMPIYLADPRNPGRVERLPLGMYIGMRCLMVHNYSASGFWFVNGSPDYHLKKVRPKGDQDPKAELVCIDLDTLIKDVKSAAEAYCDDLGKNEVVYLNFINQTRERKLLRGKTNYEVYDEATATWQDLVSQQSEPKHTYDPNSGPASRTTITGTGS